MMQNSKTMPTYEWKITLRTTTTTPPSHSDLQTSMNNLFGTTATNVALSGPQSVDDGPGGDDSE